MNQTPFPKIPDLLREAASVVTLAPPVFVDSRLILPYVLPEKDILELPFLMWRLPLKYLQEGKMKSPFLRWMHDGFAPERSRYVEPEKPDPEPEACRKEQDRFVPAIFFLVVFVTLEILPSILSSGKILFLRV